MQNCAKNFVFELGAPSLQIPPNFCTTFVDFTEAQPANHLASLEAVVELLQVVSLYSDVFAPSLLVLS